MKKKGTTESYSALIGIIIAFLMLTAIGCAVYNMYKPKSVDSFNKLVSKIKTLEKTGNEEAEYPLFLEEDWFVVGFRKGSTAFEHKTGCYSFVNIDCMEFGCPGAQGADIWGCYGFGFLQNLGTGGLPTKILKPKSKCVGDKSCLCLCKIENLNQEPFLISEQACLRSDAICASFDSINLIGSEDCCNGVFIPGVNIESQIPVTRGLKALKYKKFGDELSLSDLTKTDISKEKEKEREKIAKLREYLKTRRDVYFIPVNWDLELKEFERAVSLHTTYTGEKIKEVERSVGASMVNSLSTDFNILSVKDLQCKSIDLTKQSKDVRKDLLGCLIKSDPQLTEASLKDVIIIGITDDQETCAPTGAPRDEEKTVISYYKNLENTAHEWGHFMLFCDEYDYKKWDKDNMDGKECINPYPLCCKDNPFWLNDLSGKDYPKYLEAEKIGPNCYPAYEQLSDNARSTYKTKEEYEKYVNKFSFCAGHVCKPKNANTKYCRGIMGPEFTCEAEGVIYDDSLEYSYMDFDRIEDLQGAYIAKQTKTT
jgi:hypothetical protein